MPVVSQPSAGQTIEITMGKQVVKAEPVHYTPEQLLAIENERRATGRTGENWNTYQIPWHQNDEWWARKMKETITLDADNRIYRMPDHQKLQLTIAAGILGGFLLARL
jgi:hypothetical protein